MVDDLSIQYARTSDGVRIAYAVQGKGTALPVIVVGQIPGADPLFSPQIRSVATGISSSRRVVLFARRGLGSSQRGDVDYSLDGLSRDIDAVAAYAGLDSFALWSLSSGSVIALHYATTHADRVAAIVMDSPSATLPVTIQAIAGLMKTGVEWELVSELFPILVTGSAAHPGNATMTQSLVRIHHPADLQSQIEAIAQADLRPHLSLAVMPTLITLSNVANRQRRVEGVHDVAAGLPNARLVSVEEQTDFQAGVDFLNNFDKPNPTPEPGTRAAEAGAFRSILFTDLAAHTALMDRLGDDAGRSLLREHERITRKALADHGGTEVKTMGDGFMASFVSVSRSLECAQALQKAFAEPLETGERLSIRIGINAGEPIEEDDDLFGTSVIVAARTAASAGGGQIVVTDVVRQLVAGKEFLFSDRGLSNLKGLEDPVRTWEVLW